MEKNNEEVNVLDELCKGACMGRDAIHFILDKVEDSNLKKELDRQYKEYKKIIKKIEDIYPKYNNEDEPHKTSAVNKVMTWYGIEMKTMLDSSTSKLVELLMQGTNMGIIEGRRLLNQKHTDEEIEDLLEEYVEMQEKDLEKLKKFL